MVGLESEKLEIVAVMARFCFCIPKSGASSTKQTLGVDHIDEEVFNSKNARLYSYKELMMATENFSPANKIGQGGFGPVYKGRLKNGSMAAMKVLSVESTQGVREFLTEINVITDIEHENLVKLYGCCIEGNNRILVYGYLENNSLAQTLLGEGHNSIQFNWQTRHKICVGIAHGLAFLHEEVKPHIIHRDIKASNILLDKNLMPKISDFGLAKLIPDYATHVSTRVAGTIGYLAPEYATRGHLTKKSDIYSLGVLLMEIVTGRCNTNRRLPAEEQCLLPRVWEHFQRGKLDEMLDSSMSGDFNVNEICKVLKISLHCTQEFPELRPSISTVVKMLTGEADVDYKSIQKPGLLPEFINNKDGEGKKNEFGSKGTSSSTGLGKLVNSSSSSVNTTTSYASL